MGFRQWLKNWLLKDDEAEKYAGQDITINDDADHYDHHSNTIKLTVSTARGGCIVSVRQYDRVRDENNYSVHVIHDDEDVATSIAHIVSMELLRKS